MKTLYLAHGEDGTSVLGWSFEGADEAIECAESCDFEGPFVITELECDDDMTDAHFTSCSDISEYEETAEKFLEEVTAECVVVVEIPPQLSPQAWYAGDKEHFMSVVEETASDSDVYEKTTGQYLMDITFGVESTAELREEYEGLSYVADLIDDHGPEIVLYRGFTREEGYEYTDKPLDRWECCVEYNKRDLQNQMIFTTGREARKALADDGLWEIHQGIEAREALRNLLIEIKVIEPESSDD